MNDRSSRAHCLFMISLDQKNLDTGVSCKSRLFLADLGGSEQVKKSKVNVGTSKHIEKLKQQTMGNNGNDQPQVEEGDEPASNPNTEFSTGFKVRNCECVNGGAK